MDEECQQKDEKIFSVSDYIKLLNQGLKDFRTKIVGEVGQATIASSGHVYFSLKDEKDGSVINCIIWRNKYNLYNIDLKQGVKIIASGQPEIYSQTGKFSFVCDVIEYAGEGELKKEYEKLKKKLIEEGLFAKERKRPIPSYPQKIGVITSLKGAVVADFSNNLGKFGFKVKIIDSRVEGQAAVNDLLLSIRTFKKQDIDVLVIIRGGGSLESMSAFNNEMLVREVVGFPVPVIAGIGHHKDVSLVGLAADALVSTPTAAANILDESWEQAALFLERHERSIIDNYAETLDNARSFINQATDAIREYSDSIIDRYKKIEKELKVSFINFQNVLFNVRINLDDLITNSFSGFKTLISKVDKQLEYIEKTINSNNPERQLSLGYSIARCGGRIIRHTKDVIIGGEIDLKVSDGAIISKIKNINKNKNA